MAEALQAVKDQGLKEPDWPNFDLEGVYMRLDIPRIFPRLMKQLEYHKPGIVLWYLLQFKTVCLLFLQFVRYAVANRQMVICALLMMHTKCLAQQANCDRHDGKQDQDCTDQPELQHNSEM